MKRLLSVFSFLLISNPAVAQITFEHTYYTNYDSAAASGQNKVYTFYTDLGLHYYTYTSSTRTFSFYKADHTLIKTTNLPPDPSTEVTYSNPRIFLVTDKLFNTDNKIEFLIGRRRKVWIDNGPNYYFVTDMVLINEDAEILHVFGNRYVAHLVKAGSNSYKLILDGAPNSIQSDFEVYGLGGTLNADQEIYLERKVMLYPIPSENIVNIANSLQIGEIAAVQVFSMSGQKVLEKNVVGSDTDIELDITTLSAGSYICKINDKTIKFTKK